MLPRWHVILGAVFTFIFSIIFPNVQVFYLALMFLSTFLIDFDHYVVATMKNRHISLIRAFRYYDLRRVKEEENKSRGIREKGDFHLFHTIEFHLIVLALGFLWGGFFYIFIGMVFHSLVDIIDLKRTDLLYVREFWLLKRFFE
jgi:hypothetical protein